MNGPSIAVELDWAVYVSAPRGWRKIAAFQSVEQARAYAKARARQTGRAYIWDRNTEAT